MSEWIAALDKIELLSPRAVVASHKRPDNDDNPRIIIEEISQYIRDFDRLATTTKTAQEPYDKMPELYPNRVNPGWALLEFGARAQAIGWRFQVGSSHSSCRA